MNEVAFALLWEGLACSDHGEDGELCDRGTQSEAWLEEASVTVVQQPSVIPCSLGDALCSNFLCQVGIPFFREKSQCFSACTPHVAPSARTGPASGVSLRSPFKMGCILMTSRLAQTLDGKKGGYPFLLTISWVGKPMVLLIYWGFLVKLSPQVPLCTIGILWVLGRAPESAASPVESETVGNSHPLPCVCRALPLELCFCGLCSKAWHLDAVPGPWSREQLL